jgi:2-methylisocitrate lyase-like PEP mutase family enzyme
VLGELCDAYSGPFDGMRVVRVLEAVGAAAVELEDDVTPTLAVTCGEGGFAVDLVTTDTRRHPELVVGAGTCLRALGGLDAVAPWGGWREALPPFLAIRELESTGCGLVTFPDWAVRVVARRVAKPIEVLRRSRSLRIREQMLFYKLRSGSACKSGGQAN